MELEITRAFYTLSTIAQALAAIMGLVSAAALFRLQSIDSQMRELAEPLVRVVRSNPGLFDYRRTDEVLESIARGYFYEGARLLRDLLIATPAVKLNELEQRYLIDLRTLSRWRPRIVKVLVGLLLLSSVVIFLSVTSMYGVGQPFLVAWTNELVALCVGLFGVALVGNIQLVRLIISER